MSVNLNQLDAAGFAAFLFDREIDSTGDYYSPQWAWSCDPPSAIDLTSALLEQSRTLIFPFTPEQLEQGFWFLLGYSFGLNDWLWQSQYALESRLRCVASMVNVFRDIFQEKETETICYMWWDLVVTYSASQEESMRDAVFEALTEVLAMDSPRCQRAALHGLGHLRHKGGPAAIDRWVAAQRGLDPDLAVYAQAAKAGRVQ